MAQHGPASQRSMAWLDINHRVLNVTNDFTLPVRMECTTLLASHMVAPDCPSLATQLCCRMLAQRCRISTQAFECTAEGACHEAQTSGPGRAV